MESSYTTRSFTFFKKKQPVRSILSKYNNRWVHTHSLVVSVVLFLVVIDGIFTKR